MKRAGLALACVATHPANQLHGPALAPDQHQLVRTLPRADLFSLHAMQDLVMKKSRSSGGGAVGEQQPAEACSPRRSKRLQAQRDAANPRRAQHTMLWKESDVRAVAAATPSCEKPESFIDVGTEVVKPSGIAIRSGLQQSYSFGSDALITRAPKESLSGLWTLLPEVGHAERIYCWVFSWSTTSMQHAEPLPPSPHTLRSWWKSSCASAPLHNWACWNPRAAFFMAASSSSGLPSPS